MAFVDGYEHDVVISYNDADNCPLPETMEGLVAALVKRLETGNGPLPETTEGWVAALVKRLETGLAQKILPRGSCSLWTESRVSAEVINKITNTAIILIVLSRNYIASGWCKRGSENFLKLVQQKTNAGMRVFIIEIDRLEDTERPEEFKNTIGYHFYVVDSEDKLLRTLTPTSNHDKKEYYGLINDLVSDVAEELKRQINLADSAHGDEAAYGPNNLKSNVYLAEVTDDLEPQRDEIKRYLNQIGISRVYPEILYPRESAAFKQVAEKDIANCKLFVQLLSGVSGRKPSKSENSYPRIQYELAKKAAMPILQWRSPDLDMADVIDKNQFAFLELDTVMAISIGDFKDEIRKQAFSRTDEKKVSSAILFRDFKNEIRKRVFSRPYEKKLSSESPFVFINAEQNDMQLAESIGKTLNNHKIGYVLPKHLGDTKSIRDELEKNILNCNGIIVVHGNSPLGWVKNQLLILRKYLIKRKNPMRALAIYEGSAEEKYQLDIKIPGISIINCCKGLDEREFNFFLVQLGEGKKL